MRKILGTLLLITSLLLAACGQSAKPAQTQGSGGSISQNTDVKAAMDVDFTTMDPQDISDILSGGIARMVMEGLFNFDKDMKIYPLLATGYKANDTATEFTITLRKGIKFSDGTPWNADAAIANVKKWKGEGGIKLKRTTFLSGTIKSVEKVDDYTIKFILNKPFGAFIANLAHPCCVMMSPKQIAAGLKACASKPVGTGQYKFVEWIVGDHLKVELNKDWWGYNADICGGKALADKDAGFKSITFKPVAESATRVAMVQSGDAQFVWPVPTENLATLKADSKVKLYQQEGIMVRYLFMNNKKKPFTDVRVRQAINYAIDKNAYIKVVKNGVGSLATSIIAPSVQFYKKNEPMPYDPAKAKELLAQAGYPNGFKATLMFSNTTSNQKQAQFFKQQLAQVGIEVELKGMENAVLNSKVEGNKGPGENAEVELYIIGWSPGTVDADWGIRPLLAKESQPPMSYNICYYDNPELEQYIKQGLTSADEKIRRDAYAKAQDLIWKDVPMVFLTNEFNTWATSSKVSGVILTPGGGINVSQAKMIK